MKFTTIEKLEIVHADLNGPTKTKGLYGERYFMILVDDFSTMMWVAFLKEKFEAFDKFKIFKNRVENEFGMKIKCLRLDRRGEFTSNEFNMICEENGIKRQLLAPRTLEQNGVAERRNKSVIEAARAMLAKNRVSKTFWREAMNIVVYIMKRVQVRKDTNKTPYELWFGHSPIVRYFKKIGSVISKEMMILVSLMLEVMKVCFLVSH